MSVKTKYKLPLILISIVFIGRLWWKNLALSNDRKREIEALVFNPDSLEMFSRGRLEMKPGHVYVINLWATWCKPCLKEIPELNQFRHTYTNERIHFWAITNEDSILVSDFFKDFKIVESFDYALFNSQGKASKYLAKFSLDPKQMPGSTDSSIPVNLIVKNNKILFFKNGANPDVIAEMKIILEKNISASN